MRACLRHLSLFVLLCPSLASAQPGIAFRGTAVTPLGGATVTVSPATGALVVGNIGPGGGDGFELFTGAADGGSLTWSPAPALPGRELRFEVITGSPGIEPCLTMTTTLDGGMSILPDFSSTGADGHIVEVFLDGIAVAQTVIPLGAFLTSEISPSSFDAWGRLFLSGTGPLPPLFAPLPMLRAGVPGGTTFHGPGGPIAFGDELRIFPSNAGSVDHDLQKIVVLCSVPAPSAPHTMEFDDFAQIAYGRLHRGTLFGIISKDLDGPVRLSVPPGELGGIQLDMHRSETSATITQNLKFASAGDTDALSVEGELLGGTNVELGHVSTEYDGAAWTLAPDFSGSGSPGASVQLFDALGESVTPPLPVSAPILVGSAEFPTETGVNGRYGLEIEFGYASPVAVTLPEGTFLASRIAMTPATPVAHDHFTRLTRTVSLVAGGDIAIIGEPNGIRTGDDGFYCFSGLAGGFARNYAPLLYVETFDPGGGSFVFEPLTPSDQFGIEWVPAAPEVTPGETDWDFVSRLASDDDPVTRMAIRMVPDGLGLALYAAARQTPKTDFGSVLKTGATTTASFVHSSETVPFAILPAWPVAVGYQVLHHPDQTWSMWINLGQPMDVLIPEGPADGNAAAPAQVVTADFIHLTFLDTPVSSTVQEAQLVMRSYEASHRLMHGKKSRAVSVGETPRRPGPLLRAPYPNPFNPSTTLSFDLPAAGEVTVKVYTVRGHHVATLHSGRLAAGPHTMTWDGIDQRGRRAASGVYIAELRAPGGTSRAKLNLIK